MIEVISNFNEKLRKQKRLKPPFDVLFVIWPLTKSLNLSLGSVISLKTRPYTRQHQSRAGGQGQYARWAGAVTEIFSPFSSNRPRMRSDYGRTDGRTDGPT